MTSIASASLMADLRRWPADADDVFVEVLPGAEPESEAPAAQHGQRRGELRHHRGVVADRRAGDGGSEAQSVGARRDCTEHGPRPSASGPGCTATDRRSEIAAKSKPAFSALHALRTSSHGPCSSLMSL